MIDEGEFDDKGVKVRPSCIAYIVLYCTLITVFAVLLAVPLARLADTKRDLLTSITNLQTNNAQQAGVPACNVLGFDLTTVRGQQLNSTFGFVQNETANHFAAGEVQFQNPLTTQFACIDAREDTAIFGSPGGDISELSMALAIYFNQTNTPYSQVVVSQWVDAFMTTIATPTRPFYYHSDTNYMGWLLGNLSMDPSLPPGVRLTVFPYTYPTTLTPQTWLDAISSPKYQGCGHVRYVLRYPQKYGFWGMESLPAAVIQEVVAWLWRANGSDRMKFDIRILSGQLEGKAVAIFRGSCGNNNALYPPMYHGSSVFMYTDTAVATFREKALTPLFSSRDARVDGVAFLKALNNLAQVQLGATLELLPQVLPLGIYTVNARTAPKPSSP